MPRVLEVHSGSRKARRWYLRPVLRLSILREGLQYGFPLCCVLRFALNPDPNGPQAVGRGIMGHRTDNPWVPCNVFHRGVPWEEVQQIRLEEWADALPYPPDADLDWEDDWTYGPEVTTWGD